MEQNEILSRIKDGVQEVIPDAKVYLFGSRARGDWNEESDWDILVLTKEKYPKEMKQRLYDKFFSSHPAIAYWLQFVLATKALLLTKDLVIKTHKGLELLLQQHFVQTGLFEKDKAVLLKNLMNKRAESDYGDMLIEDEEEIKPVIKSANEYFQYVTQMVEDYLIQKQ